MSQVLSGIFGPIWKRPEKYGKITQSMSSKGGQKDVGLL
jgi:hypothetical protein